MYKHLQHSIPGSLLGACVNLPNGPIGVAIELNQVYRLGTGKTRVHLYIMCLSLESVNYRPCSRIDGTPDIYFCMCKTTIRTIDCKAGGYIAAHRTSVLCTKIPRRLQCLNYYKTCRRLSDEITRSMSTESFPTKKESTCRVFVSNRKVRVFYARVKRVTKQAVSRLCQVFTKQQLRQQSNIQCNTLINNYRV